MYHFWILWPTSFHGFVYVNMCYYFWRLINKIWKQHIYCCCQSFGKSAANRNTSLQHGKISDFQLKKTMAWGSIFKTLFKNKVSNIPGLYNTVSEMWLQQQKQLHIDIFFFKQCKKKVLTCMNWVSDLNKCY